MYSPVGSIRSWARYWATPTGTKSRATTWSRSSLTRAVRAAEDARGGTDDLRPPRGDQAGHPGRLTRCKNVCAPGSIRPDAQDSEGRLDLRREPRKHRAQRDARDRLVMGRTRRPRRAGPAPCGAAAASVGMRRLEPPGDLGRDFRLVRPPFMRTTGGHAQRAADAKKPFPRLTSRSITTSAERNTGAFTTPPSPARVPRHAARRRTAGPRPGWCRPTPGA